MKTDKENELDSCDEEIKSLFESDISMDYNYDSNSQATRHLPEATNYTARLLTNLNHNRPHLNFQKMRKVLKIIIYIESTILKFEIFYFRMATNFSIQNESHRI